MMGSLKKDYIWNTLGTSIYAFFSMVLVFAALRAAGPDDGGIFSFGFSTLGQQMFIVAYFGIRPYHITDTAYEYSYRDYSALRRVTAFAAAVIALLYLGLMMGLGYYGLRKSVIIFLLALYKIMDAVADLYESECQRIGRLYIGGMELAARSILTGGSMLILMLFTKDIVMPVLVSLVLQIISIGYFRRYMETVLLRDSLTGPGRDAAAAATGKKYSYRTRHRELGLGTAVIFLSVFLDFYIFSAPRYAVDMYLTDAASGIFNVIFMPASIIYIVANFIIRPYLGRLSTMWNERDIKGFRAKVRGLVVMMSGISLAGLIAAVILAKPALGLIESAMGAEYEGLLTARYIELILIVTGGCLYAATNVFYYVLIIMRWQKILFAEYLAMTVVAFAVVNAAVRSLGMLGGALSLAVYMGIFIAAMAITAQIGVGRAELKS